VIGHGIRFGPAPGGGLRVLGASTLSGGIPTPGIKQRPHLSRWPDSFLFAHIVAEVCDALALVVIALGLSKRVAAAPLVAGAAQHR